MQGFDRKCMYAVSASPAVCIKDVYSITPCHQDFCPFGKEKWAVLAKPEQEGMFTIAKVKGNVQIFFEVLDMKAFLKYAKRYKIKVLKKYPHLNIVLVESNPKKLITFIAKLKEELIIGAWKNVPVKSTGIVKK